MANPKYLVQRRKGQEDHIYNWTPTLAKKKDMFDIDEEEAKAILEAEKHKGHTLVEAKPETEQPKVAKKQRINPEDVINNNRDQEEEYKEPETVDEYNPANDPIVQKIYGLKTKNQVEGCALEMGFKLNITKKTRMKDMKKQLTELHIQRMTDILAEQEQG